MELMSNEEKMIFEVTFQVETRKENCKVRNFYEDGSDFDFHTDFISYLEKSVGDSDEEILEYVWNDVISFWPDALLLDANREQNNEIKDELVKTATKLQVLDYTKIDKKLIRV